MIAEINVENKQMFTWRSFTFQQMMADINVDVWKQTNVIVN